MTVSSAQVVLLAQDPTDFPAGRNLTSGTGTVVTNFGAQQPVTVSVTGSLLDILNMNSSGFTVYNAISGHYLSQVLTAGTGISITNTSGLSSPVIAQIPKTVVQKIVVANSIGVPQLTTSQINFIPGSGITIGFTNVGSGAAVGVTISATGGGSGSVTSVAAASTTGIVVTGSPITSSGTINLNLPGTGTSAAVVKGDLLIGGLLGAYIPLAAGAVGNILQVGGSGQIVWGSSSSSFVWSVVAGTSQTMAAANGYVTANGSLTTFTLPATAVVGATFQVYGLGTGGWKIVPGTSTQTIRLGSSVTTASTGYLQDLTVGECVQLVCINATTPGSEIFGVISGVGNITVN